LEERLTSVNEEFTRRTGITVAPEANEGKQNNADRDVRDRTSLKREGDAHNDDDDTDSSESR
jgi:hypothetical protein